MRALPPRGLLVFAFSLASLQLAAAATYTIKPGDSLERIARKHGCTADALAKANGLKMNAVIHPGQTLTLPGSGSSADAAPSNGTAKVPATGTHTVQPGDTLYAISRKYGVPVNQLKAANPGLKPNKIQPGQKILLGAAADPDSHDAPATPPVVAAVESAPAQALQEAPPPTTATDTEASVPATESTPMPATETDATAETALAAAATGAATADTVMDNADSADDGNIRSVIVDSEMTFGEFASQHGTTIERLNDLNGLDLSAATVLAKGSELYVPSQP